MYYEKITGGYFSSSDDSLLAGCGGNAASSGNAGGTQEAGGSGASGEVKIL